MHRRAIIQANGEPPTGPAAKRWAADLASGACFVTCDRFDPQADFAVGDGDTLTAEEKAALGARWIRVDEQDTNDLCKAYRFLVSRLAPDDTLEISIYGATGLREDHALGNIFHLLDFETDRVRVEMVTSFGVFTVVRSARTYATEPGRVFSVFAPTSGTSVTSEGLAWPLAGVDFCALWRGTLNRAVADTVCLAVTHPILVYQPW